MGPYDTEAQTRAEPLPMARAAAGPGLPPGTGRIVALDHLLGACREAGVEVGEYDRQILTWLAGWEPTTVQVVIGLITRAAAANQPTTAQT